MINRKPSEKAKALKQLVTNAAFQDALSTYRAGLEQPHQATPFLQGKTCCQYWADLNRSCPRSRIGRDVFRAMERSEAL